MTQDKYGNAMPDIGDIVHTSRGKARVLRVYVFGTMDVEMLEGGLRYRITGLGWLS
jgi:hypothetical protein